jgi:AcrR family transcriptional regulator
VKPRGRRPSGAGDTREEILLAARELFAQNGFDRTTLRAVASRAGVDPALIGHYFANKDGLLRASLALPLDPAVLLAGLDADRENAGPELARRALTLWDSSPEVRARMVAILRTAVSHEHAAALVREIFGSTILRGLGGIAASDQRELRATLVGSHLGGLLMGRYVLAVPGLAEASVDDLVAATGPVLQHYLTGTLASSA